MSEIELIREVDALRKEMRRVIALEVPYWIYPASTSWAGTSGQPLVSTSYDGNDTVTTGTVTIDTSALFAVPAGAKAVNAYFQATWAAASPASSLQVKLTGDSNVIGRLAAHTTGARSMNVVVPCDANGDFDVVVVGASATNTVIRILGYQV